MKNSPVPSVVLAQGICSDPDGPDFFSTRPEDVRRAKNLCALCPVRFKCLEYALSVPETYGVWGGADQWEIRSACAVTPQGDAVKKSTPAKCPFCRSSRHVSEVRDMTTRASRAECKQCGLNWKRWRSFVKKKRVRRGELVPMRPDMVDLPGFPDAA